MLKAQNILTVIKKRFELPSLTLTVAINTATDVLVFLF